jgi:uncharacterized protein
MLELRPSCELCTRTFGLDADDAMICTYECTFCRDCAVQQLHGICPNCGGEFVTRPRRPANLLAQHPASTIPVHKAHDIAAHQAGVRQRLVTGNLPEQRQMVVFVTERPVHREDDGYITTAERMDELARAQPGFLDVESVRAADGGLGITVSWWSSTAATLAWRALGEHTAAQQRGRDDWYNAYRLEIGRVERTSAFRSEA